MGDDLFILTLDDMQQSAVDPADPTRLVFDYMRRIAGLLDAVPPAPPARLRVLHVGGAAMNLPRYVAATRPGSAQIVLEPSVAVIEEVRATVPLPPRSGIKVRPVTGQEGLPAVREASQDVVVLDAFEGGHTPDELMGAAFVADVGRVLAPGGVLVANLVDRAPFQRIRAFVAAARELGEVAVGVEPATLKGRRAGNLVVACGAVPEGAYGDPSPLEYRVYRGRAVADSFGGGRPL